MSKKEKSSKKDKGSKGSSKVDAQKTKVKEAKEALVNYLDENKIKRDKVPTKHEKPVSRLQKDIDKEEKILKGMSSEVKEKVKKTKVDGVGRKTKYVYPAGMDDPDERKKFRSAQRSLAKKKEKGDKPAKSEKTSSKEEKSSKKLKKSSKEAEAPVVKKKKLKKKI